MNKKSKKVEGKGKKKFHKTLDYLLILQPNTLIPFNYLQLASKAGKKLLIIKIT